MGIQIEKIDKVEQLHGMGKKATSKGFSEAFVVSQGSDGLNPKEQMKTPELGLREEIKDRAHESKAVKAVIAVKAVKKEGLSTSEPFLAKIISAND